jgi:N-acetylglucosaminyl-diphospho-decaprenol L-rhamnosyltransferase
VPAGLDVVIVSYRCEELLRSCLESLRAHPAPVETRVQVVDNASGDGTAEMVAHEFPEVELTVNDRNVGFSAANNLAIARGSAPYVLVMNPDVRLTAGALRRLLALMDERAEVGISGPKLLRPDGSLDHAGRRAFPTPLSALGHFTGLGRREGAGGALAAYRAPGVERGPVDAVNGAFMLIRRSALDEVGLFDEGYWMYMEDLDLSYRFARAGWITYYEPDATAVHEKGGSAGDVRDARLTRAFHYGMYRFYRKHYASERNLLLNLAVYCGIGVKLVLALARSFAIRAVWRIRETGPGGVEAEGRGSRVGGGGW